MPGGVVKGKKPHTEQPLRKAIKEFYPYIAVRFVPAELRVGDLIMG